jgi:hypothetical protein
VARRRGVAGLESASGRDPFDPVARANRRVSASGRAGERSGHGAERAPRSRRPEAPDRQARARARRAVRVVVPAPRHRLERRRGGRPTNAFHRRAGADPGRAGRAAGRRAGGAGAACGCRGAEPRARRADDRRPGRPPLGDRLERGRGRARLPPLALAAALGHPRDAAGLVASPAVVGLSVSPGAPAPGGHRQAQTPRISWEA